MFITTEKWSLSKR